VSHRRPGLIGPGATPGARPRRNHIRGEQGPPKKRPPRGPARAGRETPASSQHRARAERKGAGGSHRRPARADEPARTAGPRRRGSPAARNRGPGQRAGATLQGTPRPRRAWHQPSSGTAGRARDGRDRERAGLHARQTQRPDTRRGKRPGTGASMATPGGSARLPRAASATRRRVEPADPCPAPQPGSRARGGAGRTSRRRGPQRQEARKATGRKTGKARKRRPTQPVPQREPEACGIRRGRQPQRPPEGAQPRVAGKERQRRKRGHPEAPGHRGRRAPKRAAFTVGARVGGGAALCPQAAVPQPNKRWLKAVDPAVSKLRRPAAVAQASLSWTQTTMRIDLAGDRRPDRRDTASNS